MATQLQSDGDEHSVVEQALRLFRERQAEVDRLREELQPALEELARDEEVPLEMDEIREELRREFPEAG